jgi:hypothetical protein
MLSPPEMAQHLLHAADMYDCPRLRCLCERRLAAALSVETVCDTLMLAEATSTPTEPHALHAR